MKGFFNSEAKPEKITEKAFTQGLLISLICIGICIVALCSVTYAWFSAEASSGSNTLSSGSFGVTATVTDTSGNTITPDGATDDVYSFTLSAGTYLVSLTLTPASNVNGYCKMTLNADLEMRTAPITRADGYTADFTFTLVIIEPTALTLESRWGIVAAPDINSGDTIDLGSTDNNND